MIITNLSFMQINSIQLTSYFCSLITSKPHYNNQLTTLKYPLTQNFCSSVKPTPHVGRSSTHSHRSRYENGHGPVHHEVDQSHNNGATRVGREPRLWSKFQLSITPFIFIICELLMWFPHKLSHVL